MVYYSVTWQCYWDVNSELGHAGAINLLTQIRISGGTPAIPVIYAGKSFQGRAIYPSELYYKGVGPWEYADQAAYTGSGIPQADGTNKRLWHMGFGTVYATNSGMWTGTLHAGTYDVNVIYQGYLTTAMKDCIKDDSFYMNVVIF